VRTLILATDIFTRGGIARYTWTLASTLGELAGPQNVDLFPFLDQWDEAPGQRTEDFRLLEAVTTRPSLKAKLKYALKAIGQRRGYDLVICSHVALAPVAAIMHLASGTSYWIVCHGTEVWPKFSRRLRAGVTRADLLLPVSRFTLDKLAGVNRIPAGKMRVLYNAVSRDFQNLLEQPAAGAWADEAGDGTILSVGSLDVDKCYKGFDTVIQALPQVLAAVPRARYVIVGRGSDQPRLERMALDLGVLDRVVFSGELSDRELAGRYRACEVFALPSRSFEREGRWKGEGFGRVYVEAALAGKPVVGSRHGGAAEAVLDGQTGYLVDASSIPEVAGALVAILTRPAAARQMGEAGRRWAGCRFTQAALRKSLDDLLATRGYRTAAAPVAGASLAAGSIPWPAEPGRTPNNGIPHVRNLRIDR
jgi:phosphatidyl-myo-inositol dimannoside synthase